MSPCLLEIATFPSQKSYFTATPGLDFQAHWSVVYRFLPHSRFLGGIPSSQLKSWTLLLSPSIVQASLVVPPSPLCQGSAPEAVISAPSSISSLRSILTSKQGTHRGRAPRELRGWARHPVRLGFHIPTVEGRPRRPAACQLLQPVWSRARNHGAQYLLHLDPRQEKTEY